MELDKKEIRIQELVVLYFGGVALIALTIFFNKPAFYDEDDYLKNVRLIQEYGLSKAYLLRHIGSAGPLYPILHYILEPITGLQTPYIRFVNILLLGGSVWLTSLTLLKLNFSRTYAWLALAVPMTYVISGLALTEMPAIFFYSAAMYLLVKRRFASSSFLKAALQSALAGLFISFAILGRQPFLLSLGALPILFFNKEEHIRNGSLFIITIIFSLVLPAYVFYVWNGLVAPDDAALYTSIANEGVSLRPDFVLLCLAYYAIGFLIVTPHFYIRPTLKEVVTIILLIVGLTALNFKYQYFLYLPVRFLFERALPTSGVQGVEVISGTLLLIGGLWFVFTLGRQLIRLKYPIELLFFTAAILSVAVACIKITWGFSSRYPAQALPFIVPMFAYFYKQSKFNIYRIAAGVLLGLISFASYIVTES